MRTREQVTSMLVGLLALAGVCLISYAFIAALLDKLGSLDSEVSKAIIGASLAVFGAALTLTLGKLWEQRISNQQHTRQKKFQSTSNK
jgi:hypothetical protein